MKKCGILQTEENGLKCSIQQKEIFSIVLNNTNVKGVKVFIDCVGSGFKFIPQIRINGLSTIMNSTITKPILQNDGLKCFGKQEALLTNSLIHPNLNRLQIVIDCVTGGYEFVPQIRLIDLSITITTTTKTEMKRNNDTPLKSDLRNSILRTG